MRAKVIAPGTIYFLTDKPFEVSYMFMRMQEFYECSDISRQGKFFTLDSVIENDAKTSTPKKFGYLDKFAGYNVPGDVVDDFRELYNHDFTERETVLFDALDCVFEKHDSALKGTKYYLIGSYSDGYLDHECAHAFYYLHPKYRAKMKKLIATLTNAERSSIHKFLMNSGYADKKAIIDDEIQAYLATNDMYYTREYMFEELSKKARKNLNWNRIYQFVETYWEFKNEVELEYDDQEVVLPKSITRRAII